MSVVMKKHPIERQHLLSEKQNAILKFTYMGNVYNIPETVLHQYKRESDTHSISASDLFMRLDRECTKAGALLKGLRYREGLTQVEFAKKINVTQADLSKMENGHRSIGKAIAKRIEKAFGTDYRYFLE